MTDAPVPATQGRFDHILYVLRSNPVTMIAFAMLGFILFCAIFGPSLVPYDPLQTHAANALQPPSYDHWFGTDQIGRDVFSRVIVATRLDLTISVLAVAMSFVVGSILGAAAGYWGGWLDIVLNRVLDTIMAFPLFVLAMGIVAALGNTVRSCWTVITVTGRGACPNPAVIAPAGSVSTTPRCSGWNARSRNCCLSIILW